MLGAGNVQKELGTWMIKIDLAAIHSRTRGLGQYSCIFLMHCVEESSTVSHVERWDALGWSKAMPAQMFQLHLMTEQHLQTFGSGTET